MANISSKISSIEPEDDSAVKAVLSSGEKAPKMDGPKYEEIIEEKLEQLEAPRRPTTQLEASSAPSFSWINITIILAIAAWLVCVGGIAYSAFTPAAGAALYTPAQWAGLAVFAAAPILILLTLRHVLKQLSSLSGQANVLNMTAQNLLSPDDTAVSRGAIMARNIKAEVDQLNRHIDKAISRTATLQETLEGQIKSIDRTTYLAENKTELIARQLKDEREALTAIATTYDERMAALSENLDTHSANLAKSTQAAEQRINEARISVEGVAAKINSASEIVRENTIEAANKLDVNQTEIARLGAILKTRAEELDQVYTKHADDLSTLVSDLRDEQENLGLSLETGLQKMRDMSMTAQVSARHLTDASTSGRKTVEALADAARLTDTAVKQRFADMEEMVRFSNARAESISEKAARRVQESLAQTRKEISRIEYDMVAMQDRLKYSDTEERARENADHADTSGNASTDPALAHNPQKRRGILGLRPILEKSEPDTELAVDPELTAERIEEPEEAPTLKRRLSGLRPAPETTEEFSIPAMDDDTADLVIPDDDIRSAVVTQTEPPALVLEIPSKEDIFTQDPDEDIKNFDPDFRRPGAPDPRHDRKEEKSKSWWKSLFGGGEETSAIDQITQPYSASAQTSTIETTSDALQTAAVSTSAAQDDGDKDADVVARLASIGLAPAAIVDDGCIIEAVNTRISKGPLAMSDVITHRLEDPVRHLFGKTVEEPELKTQLTAFARRFHHSLEPIEKDREAIRSRFESDAGRAFLLCDAALNR
ncbi:MAG: hypothetical protein ACSHXY_01725 [Alphaproteobacteria bacterium]